MTLGALPTVSWRILGLRCSAALPKTRQRSQAFWASFTRSQVLHLAGASGHEACAAPIIDILKACGDAESSRAPVSRSGRHGATGLRFPRALSSADERGGLGAVSAMHWARIGPTGGFREAWLVSRAEGRESLMLALIAFLATFHDRCRSPAWRAWNADVVAGGSPTGAGHLSVCAGFKPHTSNHRTWCQRDG